MFPRIESVYMYNYATYRRRVALELVVLVVLVELAVLVVLVVLVE